MNRILKLEEIQYTANDHFASRLLLKDSDIWQGILHNLIDNGPLIIINFIWSPEWKFQLYHADNKMRV